MMDIAAHIAGQRTEKTQISPLKERKKWRERNNMLANSRKNLTAMTVLYISKFLLPGPCDEM